MAKAEPGASNIFNITAPERYRCQIHHYHSRLSRLYLKVFKDQREAPAFYLLFTDIGYIDAPVNWQGVEFDIASEDDCIALMLERGLIGPAILRFPGAYASITEHARLYMVNTGENPIRIIAGSASMLQRIPPEIE